MNSQANDVSPEAMQARIQQARREAETLKDRIKRKKDELADTTRMLISRFSQFPLGENSCVSPGLSIDAAPRPAMILLSASAVEEKENTRK